MIIYARDEVQTIACRRLGCLGRVLFVPSRMPDFSRTAGTNPEQTKKRVYLTCDNLGEQHEYEYEVTIHAPSSTPRGPVSQQRDTL